MPSFKKPKKDKKKAKKGKSPGDKEWSYEGGQSFESNQVENDEITKNRRRETQDRDERMRRGRITIETRKKRKNEVKKMSTPVSFNKVVGIVEEPSMHLRPTKRQRIEPPVSQNKLSVMDKLKLMVGGLSRSNDDEDLETNVLEVSNASSDSEQDSDVETNDNNDDDTKDRVGNYDWFFSSNEDEDIVTIPKASKIEHPLLCHSPTKSTKGHFNCDTIYGWLHPNSHLYKMKSIKHIPNVHKMWKNLNSPELNEFGMIQQSLLPFISNYVDSYLEGCNYKNQSDILSTVMLHSMLHIVKCR